MDKIRLTNNVVGLIPVRAQDVARLARIAHEMRQEITDPRLDHVGRAKYAETIEAIDDLIQNAGGEDDAE